jgi:large subunit ribosomal protein L15
MRLHDLKPNRGAVKRRKRIGCGESSGHGKTSCKGHKGQKARAGAGIRPGFEGGQMPLFRRLPKKGFSNAAFKTKVEVVNLSSLEKAFADGDTVTELTLREKNLVNRSCDQVKILGNGEITRKLTVQVDHVSASAREKIEKAGGTVATA